MLLPPRGYLQPKYTNTNTRGFFIIPPEPSIYLPRGKTQRDKQKEKEKQEIKDKRFQMSKDMSALDEKKVKQLNIKEPHLSYMPLGSE